MRRRAFLRGAASLLTPLTPMLIDFGVSTVSGGGAELVESVTPADILIRIVNARGASAHVNIPTGWALFDDGERLSRFLASNMGAAIAWAPGGTNLREGEWTATSAATYSDVLLAYSNVDMDHEDGPCLETRVNTIGTNVNVVSTEFSELPGYAVRILGAHFLRNASQGTIYMPGLTEITSISNEPVDGDTTVGHLFDTERPSVTTTTEATGTHGVIQAALRPRFAA